MSDSMSRLGALALVLDLAACKAGATAAPLPALTPEVTARASPRSPNAG